MLRVKRAYDPPSEDDGFRILVDRIWPRGMTRERIRIDLWLKEVAPSNELRKWFGHDPGRWDEFKERYYQELAEKEDIVGLISEKISSGDVTLVFGAKDEKVNNAVALKEYLLREP
ncbi:MAG: DUF488 domain-containing protein [Methanothrix sp.]|jgi:uncharacterized protein YeaO (DUF488 family)|uniref:Uroporphyrin-III C-methyltransferase n=2 Tax=Methanothrix harundinacea TaxID=301375 RepID=A0A101IJZ6_9EURY|nr:MAG: hypothetical protein APR56_03795 [Methanosaeta sp. SDB]KUK96418.1 MAG: Uncharacterized protein XE07_1089 [Methanothrix harundinacea]MDD2637622.1 DUF488 domain-containing protein [Methanothrix sp.]MDI9399116.1 DUF488 domain-containing protein [Euryarchaeota archaeon]MCP1393116.1 DUF488 domain-containing protein [Methanothrix harundinacea]